eukprot:8766793-Pyramimonas_sp.AAC.1
MDPGCGSPPRVDRGHPRAAPGDEVAGAGRRADRRRSRSALQGRQESGCAGHRAEGEGKGGEGIRLRRMLGSLRR